MIPVLLALAFAVVFAAGMLLGLIAAGLFEEEVENGYGVASN
jgi:hypothetical protein